MAFLETPVMYIFKLYSGVFFRLKLFFFLLLWFTLFGGGELFCRYPKSVCFQLLQLSLNETSCFLTGPAVS